MALGRLIRAGIRVPERLKGFSSKALMWEAVDADFLKKRKSPPASTAYDFENARQPCPVYLLVGLAELYGFGPSAARSEDQIVWWFRLPCDEFAKAYENAIDTGQIVFPPEQHEGTGTDESLRSGSEAPFIGLSTMQLEHANLYFGRTRKLVEDSELLESRFAPPFFLVNGASGTGKSSYVFAGLLPRLLKSEISNGTHKSCYVSVRPALIDDTDSIASLAAAVIHACNGKIPVNRLVSLWGRNPIDIADDIIRRLPALKYIIVDQLEEIFHESQCFDRRGLFFEVLRQLSVRPSQPKIVLTIRSDFRERCIEIPSLKTALDSKHFRDLFPLGEDDLKDVIYGPAREYGIDVSEVAELLLQDAVGQSDSDNALPLLAATLHFLWQHRCGKRLAKSTLAGKGIAGVVDQLGTTAFNEFVKDNDVKAELAERVFTEVFGLLVRVPPSDQPSRRKAGVNTIESKLALQLVERLVDPRCRLLTYDRSDDHDRFIEVIHEVVFRSWGKLETWIESRKAQLRELEQVKFLAEQWSEAQPVEELVIPRVASAQRAMKVLGRTERSLSVKTKSYVFPREHLEGALLKPLSVTSHRERALIGDALLSIEQEWNGRADTRPGISAEHLIDEKRSGLLWQPIPATSRDARFWIAKWPITQAQFRAFVKDSRGYQNSENWYDANLEGPPAEFRRDGDNQPATECSWHEACAFACWLTALYSKKGCLTDGESIRLPTEGEWLRAAGGDGMSAKQVREQFDGSLPCNTYEANLKRMVAVGMYPNGFAPNGVMDLAGNVWEMCLNKFDDPSDCRIDESKGTRAMRGGSWYEDFTLGRSVVSSRRNDDRSTSIGFRLVIARSIAGQ